MQKSIRLTESVALELIHAAYGAVRAVEDDTAIRHKFDPPKVLRAIERICNAFSWGPIEEWTQKENKRMPLAAYCKECGVNEVEFPDESECAWCMARLREEEDR